MSLDPRQLPVLMPETLEALSPLKDAVVLDCTLGWGVHSEMLARQGARVVALDRDAESIARATARLAEAGVSVTARHTDYAAARKVLSELGLPGVDALVADLGISSMQLDDPERGMSFEHDGPLDMRIDRSRGQTAAQWLETAGESEIVEILARYGEDPDAEKIAGALAALRAQGRSPKTTAELARAVSAAKTVAAEAGEHPALRTFRALRIAVNHEPDSLRSLLAELPKILRPGGRIVIFSFHPAEEALIGRTLREQAAAGLWQAPLPEPLRRPADEIRRNPRARFARMWRAVRASRG